ARVERMPEIEEADHLAKLRPERIDMRRELERTHQVLERRCERRLREEHLSLLSERKRRPVVTLAAGCRLHSPFLLAHRPSISATMPRVKLSIVLLPLLWRWRSPTA